MAKAAEGGSEVKQKKEKKSKKSEEVAVAADVEMKGEAADAEAASSEKQQKKWENVCAIAKPLVTKKLNKKVLKLVTKAAKNKSQLKRGVKEVTKAVRKGLKGVCLIAGNISPIDVISHLPVLCEESGVPYAYVPSREDLGVAAATKRSTSVVMVLVKPVKGDWPEKEMNEFKEEFAEVHKELEDLAVLAFKK